MKKILGSIAAFALPALAFAKTIGSVDDIIDMFYQYGNIAIQIAVSLAVIYIIWGVVQYAIMSEDSDDNRKIAKNKVVYGVIGLAAILSIWGLVRIVTNTFQTEPNVAPTLPQIRRNF